MHGQLRETHRQGNGVICQPWIVRPQVFEGQPVQAKQHQAETADVHHVPEVILVSQNQPQDQVVAKQRE